MTGMVEITETDLSLRHMTSDYNNKTDFIDSSLKLSEHKTLWFFKLYKTK